MEYKKTITSFLHELNIEGFENVILRYFNEFKKVTGVDSNVIAKIEHEFILTLEALMIKNNFNVHEVFENNGDLISEFDLSLDRVMKKQQI